MIQKDDYIGTKFRNKGNPRSSFTFAMAEVPGGEVKGPQGMPFPVLLAGGPPWERRGLSTLLR